MILIFSVVLALAAALSSCAPAPIRLHFQPGDAAPVVAAGKPRIFVAEVQDRSGGPKMLGDGGSGKRASLQGNPAETMREALAGQLQAMTFSIAANPGLADATLKAVLTAIDATWTVGGSIPVQGRVAMNLSLVDGSGKIVWSDRIVGFGRSIIVGANVPGVGPAIAINGGLADAMSKMSSSLAAHFSPVPVRRPAPVEAPRAPEPDVPAASVAARGELDDLPAARARNPRAHAVVIGVERYREKLPRADFAAGDARLAAEYFKRVLGVPEENLALLVDERAAKSDFEKYFERWLPNRVEAGDEVFVYFSGHGSPNPAKGDAYLVPYDGDPTYIDQTGYPLKRMYEQLSKLPAKSVTVAMDSCFSGAGGRSVLAKGARPLVTVAVVDALPPKLTVLAAAAGDQISNSYQEKGHGLFTFFLLKGLKEKGADMKTVFEYLKPEVARTARRELNSDQEPQWRQGK